MPKNRKIALRRCKSYRARIFTNYREMMEMEGRTVELFMDEFFLWRVYGYDKNLTDILFKYKHVELETYAVVDFRDIESFPTGAPTIQHVFIFKGRRKRFAFANGMRIDVAKAMHFINDLHKEGVLSEGKEVPHELMRDTILRSV